MKGVHISIQGEAMNFANIGKSPLHPLMSAMSAKNTYAGENEAMYAIFVIYPLFSPRS
jgi:hypothetical protein